MKAADIKLNYTYRVRVGKQILSLRVDSIETLPHVGKSPPKFKYECTDLKHGKRHTILTPNNFIEDVVRTVLAGDHVTVFRGKHADGIGINTVYLVKRVEGKSVMLAIGKQEVKVPVASVKLTNEPLAVEQPPVVEAKKIGGKRGSILGQIRTPLKSSGEEQGEGEQGSDPTAPAASADPAISTAPKPLESSGKSTTSSGTLRSQISAGAGKNSASSGKPDTLLRANDVPQYAREAADFYNELCRKLKRENGGEVPGMFDSLPEDAGGHVLALHQNALKVWMSDHPRTAKNVKVSRTPTDWEVELADGDAVVITAISEPMAIGKARKQGLTLHPRYDSQACSKCSDTPVGADCPVCGRLIPVVSKGTPHREYRVKLLDGGSMIVGASSQVEAENIAVGDGHSVQRTGGRINEVIESIPSMDDTPRNLPQKSKLGARLQQNRGDEDTAPHLIVEARAGTGKTTTLVEGIKRVLGIPSPLTPSPQQAAVWDCMELSKGKVKTIAFVAFNNNIAKELKDRVPSGVAAMTNHSMGFAAVKERFGKNIKVEKNRTHELIATVLGRDYRELKGKEFEFLQQVASLVDLCKMNLVIRPDNSLRTGLTHDEQLDELISHYDIEIADRSKVYPVVPEVLNLATHPERDGMIDFADMIWLPVVLDLPMPKYDLLLGDEVQDWNRCQQALAKKAGSRLILVGDSRQAVYGFCGADSASMPRMFDELNSTPRTCQRLHLTVTRRCGKAIVEEAKKIVPDFEAFHTNCEGKVSRARYSVEKPTETQKDRAQSADSIAPATDMIPVQDYRASVRDGDFVICRVNAPLVSQCFRFLKEGRKATIRGRSIGDGLKKLVKDLKASDVTDLVGKLSDWHSQELKKEQAKRFPSEDRIIAVGDKYDCLLAFTEGFKEVDEVLGRIEQIFTDDKQGGIILSSVHKVKGLEANRVFFLMPKGGECPHPMAKSDWQREQELNIKYVGITRAIEELIIVS